MTIRQHYDELSRKRQKQLQNDFLRVHRLKSIRTFYNRMDNPKVSDLTFFADYFGTNLQNLLDPAPAPAETFGLEKPAEL